MDEFALIAELLAPLSRDAPDAFGLTDDAALMGIGEGRRLVVTKDMLVAGVHFLADDPPALVARKLLRVNLSDLAAMGATPRAYLLGLAVPRGTGDDWFRAFAGGLAEDQAAFGVHLIGGDTVSTGGPLTASLTAFGEVSAGAALRRSGALPGDTVFLSGTLGDAALGLLVARGRLKSLPAADRDFLVDRYRLPRPRVALGERLCGHAHAVIDVSDGLVADLGHICACSGVAAEIEVARVPLSPPVRAALDADPALLARVLAGGDDYELAFTAAAARPLADIAAALNLPITAIGRISPGQGVVVRNDKGAPVRLATAGWRHL